MAYGVPMMPMHGFMPVAAMPMSAPVQPNEPLPKWARPIGTVPVIPLREPAPQWAFTTPNPWGSPAPIYQIPASYPAPQPGMMQPQAQPMHPGMMQPGMMQPGMMQPGMMHPGMMHPGMMQPMQAQPPAQQQPVQPVTLQQPVASQPRASRYQPIGHTVLVQYPVSGNANAASVSSAKGQPSYSLVYYQPTPVAVVNPYAPATVAPIMQTPAAFDPTQLAQPAPMGAMAPPVAAGAPGMMGVPGQPMLPGMMLPGAQPGLMGIPGYGAGLPSAGLPGGGFGAPPGPTPNLVQAAPLGPNETPPGTLGRTYLRPSRMVAHDKHPRMAGLDVEIVDNMKIGLDSSMKVRVSAKDIYNNFEPLKGYADEDGIWHFESAPLLPTVPHMYDVRVELYRETTKIEYIYGRQVLKTTEHSLGAIAVKRVRMIPGRIVDLMVY